jgi:hypothetical protein
MKIEERAHELVSVVLDLCGAEADAAKRGQLEAVVTDHLEDVRRSAAEKAVVVYRDKTREADEKVLSETTAAGQPRAQEGP